MEKKIKVIIFSAPSGAGKTTIVRHLLKQNNYLTFSISATTRPKRPYEIANKDYYFMSPKIFKEKISKNEFIEYTEVYDGIYYGTLKSEIIRIQQSDKQLITDIDVKGGMALKKFFKEKAMAVFVKPPNIEILKERLKMRDTESEISFQKRIARVKYELSFESFFDKKIINKNLSETLEQAQQLVNEFLKY